MNYEYDAIYDSVYEAYDGTGATIVFDKTRGDASGAASTIVYGTPIAPLRTEAVAEPNKVVWVVLAGIGAWIVYDRIRKRRR